MNVRKLLFAAMAVMLSLPAAAQVPDNVVEVGILPGWREADGRHIAGLSIRLAPGWKTYWRAPGDGGIPPIFDWSGSSNVRAVGVHYPVPEVFRVNGARSIGYVEHVLFPLMIDTRDAAAGIRLNGVVELGVCQEICIPVSFEVSADLGSVGQSSPALIAALEDRAREGGAMRCEVSPIADGLRVTVETDMPPMGADEIAVIEASESGLWISEAETRRSGGTLWAEVEMVPPTAKPFALARSDVRLTVLAGGEAVEITGCR
ncbi:MAG: hypothetical protein HKM96_12555 [Boseongicola sp.]|nr:hypothetical protein [Boseongicola sp.]